jgi:hypothetical protein
MRKCICGAFVAALVLVVAGPGQADDAKDPKAIIDKAIKAMGGEEKLAKAMKGCTWKTKGTITFMGSDNEISTENTLAGLDKYRSKFTGDFGGNKIEGVSVISGDKGSASFMGQDMEMEGDRLANEKRNVYLGAVATFVVPLKEKGFKVEAAAEEKVGDKPAAVLKVTGPDGKDSKLYFDKESGLPVRQVAKVVGFDGNEYTQETTYSNYKDMGGIKKAAKYSAKRDGEKFIEMEVTEFKILDKVDPKTFEKP